MKTENKLLILTAILGILWAILLNQAERTSTAQLEPLPVFVEGTTHDGLVVKLHTTEPKATIDLDNGITILGDKVAIVDGEYQLSDSLGWMITVNIYGKAKINDRIIHL